MQSRREQPNPPPQEDNNHTTVDEVIPLSDTDIRINEGIPTEIVTSVEEISLVPGDLELVDSMAGKTGTAMTNVHRIVPDAHTVRADVPIIDKKNGPPPIPQKGIEQAIIIRENQTRPLDARSLEHDVVIGDKLILENGSVITLAPKSIIGSGAFGRVFLIDNNGKEEVVKKVEFQGEDPVHRWVVNNEMRALKRVEGIDGIAEVRGFSYASATPDTPFNQAEAVFFRMEYAGPTLGKGGLQAEIERLTQEYFSETLEEVENNRKEIDVLKGQIGQIEQQLFSSEIQSLSESEEQELRRKFVFLKTDLIILERKQAATKANQKEKNGLIRERGIVTERFENIRPAVDAMHKMHERGIVHKDIKDVNITMGTENVDAKLIDLGLATEEGKKITMQSGTPGFMAPEEHFVMMSKDLKVEFFHHRSEDIFSMMRTMLQVYTDAHEMPRFPEISDLFKRYPSPDKQQAGYQYFLEKTLGSITTDTGDRLLPDSFFRSQNCGDPNQKITNITDPEKEFYQLRLAPDRRVAIQTVDNYHEKGVITDEEYKALYDDLWKDEGNEAFDDMIATISQITETEEDRFREAMELATSRSDEIIQEFEQWYDAHHSTQQQAA
ncbi:MAG: hypothetical protein GW775_00440 [Candidatus Magasanikbacteria bacterium]|nr:hypothetical protein [Candidatus Magasanikbacteria bacterium]